MAPPAFPPPTDPTDGSRQDGLFTGGAAIFVVGGMSVTPQLLGVVAAALIVVVASCGLWCACRRRLAVAPPHGKPGPTGPGRLRAVSLTRARTDPDLSEASITGFLAAPPLLRSSRGSREAHYAKGIEEILPLSANEAILTEMSEERPDETSGTRGDRGISCTAVAMSGFL